MILVKFVFSFCFNFIISYKLLLLLLHHSFFEQKACTMIQFAKVMVFSEIKKKTTDFFTFDL